MIELVLPYPPSANRYWRTAVISGRAQTYPSKDAKQFKINVGKAAFAAGLRQPIAGRVSIEIRLYPKRPLDWARRVRKAPQTWDDDVQCIDLGNCEKVLSDALNGIAWHDDKQHRRILLERMEPDGEARVVVRIEQLALPASPQGDLIGEAA